MTPEVAPAGKRPASRLSGRRKPAPGRQAVEQQAANKTGQEPVADEPECRTIPGEGSCPEWHDLLAQFPMIDSVQREDFPEHGASFAYVAHFYRTNTIARESSCAKTQFEKFFRAIGYKYDSSGNYKSRWFEGIGIRIRQS